MKKALLFLFLTIFALSFSACGSDDDDNGDGGNTVKLTAVFKYQKDGATKPSAATQMYIFKTGGESTSDWTYNKNNHYFEKKNGSVVYSTYSFKANNDGIVSQDIENNTSYIYVYEPSIDPSIWGSDSFDTKGQPISIEKVHGLTNQ